MQIGSSLTQALAVLEKYIAQKGLRRTEERYEILRAIYEELTHFDADTLHRHLSEKGSRVSRATVYNTLELLLECGLVRRYTFGEGRTLYERSLGRRQHDHLICIECGHIEEFCDPQLGAVIQGVGMLFNMQPIRHELVIYAECTRSICPNRKESATFAKNELQP
ncbi:MAG: transcriptional repressor [Bacteroidia bacterium]|nr:transcriptional repressor [Bacteroidia bacterium]MCX7651912.1 transcriptional repressor [Bacteroidia bacterium]MDW8416063.1 transcriptional repressor [Bacteroidia bacterium]